MKRETLKGLFNFCARLAEAYNLPRMHFCWHGGEPLCTPVPHLRASLELQDRLLTPARIEARNSLQTNGTILDDARVGLLRDYAISVGISIDGWGDDYDHNRPACGERISFQRIVRNITRLREAKIPCGVLAVVDGRRSLTPLVEGLRALGVDSLAFLPCTISPEGGPLSARAIADRIIEAYAFARNTRIDNLRFRTLSSIRRAFFDLPGAVCTVGEKSCFNYLTVMPDGELTLCETLLAAGYGRAFLGLNVADPLLRPQDLASTVQERMREIDALQPTSPRCAGCEWERVCGGGCLASRFKDGKFGESASCAVSRTICEWVEDEVEELMASDDNRSSCVS